METITQCPVCKNSDFTPFLICKDYLISSEKFSVKQCSKCGFRATSPRPDSTAIGAYYKSDQYISHNDSSTGLISSTYRAVRSYTLRSKLNLINQLNNGPGKLLDVGCGTGTFLETCKSGKWSVMGMEPDPDARALATKRLSVPIESSLEAINYQNEFDVITLWHVLEHIPNLDDVLPKLKTLLATNGTLSIAVPNSDSYDAKYFKEYWAAYDVPRHLYHFTPSTIEPLFSRYGLKLIEKRPMPFDAFYISMLSTKYQTGKTNYIKSIQIGLQSNNKASRDGQYSSLTYLFRKS